MKNNCYTNDSCLVTTSSSGTLVYGDKDYTRNQYPRVIKLSNGELLMTFNKIGLEYCGFPIYRSKNSGTDWYYVTTVNPSDYGIPTEASACPTLLELPNKIGKHDKGTILLAFTLNAAVTDIKSNDTIQIVCSEDEGVSWEKHSSLESGEKGQTWEPELSISSNGFLVCYFSDERLTGYSQTISHKIFLAEDDSWIDYNIDVGIQDGKLRPGMPRVIKLKDDTYFMIYEVINAPENDGIVYYRTSPNGVNWGLATELGTPIKTESGYYPKQCPVLGFLDDSSSNGTIFVRGMNDVVENRNSSCFINTNNGIGKWEVTCSPLLLNGAQEEGAAWSGSFLDIDTSHLLEINTAYNGNYMEVRCAIGDYSKKDIQISKEEI